MKIQKAIRRISADGRTVLNAAVAANIGETGEASAASVQHAQIVQRNRRAKVRPFPTHKES